MTAQPVRKIKHAATLVQRKKQYEPSDGPYVGLEHIRSWTGEVVASAESTPEGTVSLFEPGDVLFGKLRPYLAKVSLATEPGASSTEALVLRARSDVWPPYLRYVMVEKGFIDSVTASTFGAQMPRASWEFIGSQLIPTPDIPTQRAIADFLDRETARIDRLIEKKGRLKVLLIEKRKATIKRLSFGQHLSHQCTSSGVSWIPDLPHGWIVQRVSRLFQNLDSVRIPLNSEERADLERIYPYYGASGIIDKVDRYLFDQDLILVGEDGANLVLQSTPVAFIATGKYWVNNHAHILKPRTGPLAYWVNVLNQVPYEIYVTGSAQPKLTADALGSLPLPVPPIPMQHSIADLIGDQSRAIDDLLLPLDESIDRLRELRAALITAAVTGQIDPAAWGRRGETDRRLEAIERSLDSQREPAREGAPA